MAECYYYDSEEIIRKKDYNRALVRLVIKIDYYN